MAYLDIPKEFFINACSNIKLKPNRHRSELYFDLSGEFVKYNGVVKDKNTSYAFGCTDFDMYNKDIIDFCYNCFNSRMAGCSFPQDRYGFDGEHITINSEFAEICLDSTAD